jgi:hypothetical protein
MKIYRYLIILLLALLPLGCKSIKSTSTELGQLAYNNYNIETVESSGKPVLNVAGQTITTDDIILPPIEFNDKTANPVDYFAQVARLTTLEQFKVNARKTIEEILRDKISNIILYQYAKKQFPESNEESLTKAAESELRKFELRYDSDQAKADDALKKLNMDRRSFVEQQKKSILIQWYLGNELKDETPITYRELQEQYEKMKDEYFAADSTIQFSLIDIQPARLTTNDPNLKSTELAEKLARELLVQLNAGADFAELAKKYSNGPMSESGGLWRAVHPDSLAAPYDWIGQAALKTESGKIAELHITPQHVFIMKLESKDISKYKPFEEVQKQVQNAVLAARRNEGIKKINSIMLQQTNLSQADKFIDFCLEEIYRKIQQQKSS